MCSRLNRVRRLVFASAVLVFALPACRLSASATPPPPATRPPLASPATITAQPAVTPSDIDHINIAALTGRLVFAAGPPHDVDIYVINADGTHLQRLTTAPGDQFDPAFSPNGTRIVYRDSRRGHNHDDEIYVMNSDGSEPINLTHNPANEWGPSWSPDGTKIIFNSDRDGGGEQHLYIMNSDGSGVQRIGDRTGEYPAWAPHRAKVVFGSLEPSAAGNDPDFNIYVTNVDGSGATRLTDYPGQDDWAAWSPDGTKIVYESTRDNPVEPGNLAPLPDIWVMNADGSAQTRLTFTHGERPAWSPDGRYIIFGGANGLYVMHADGSNVTPLRISGVSNPAFPNWTQ